jgi:hypothetical protein
VVPNIRYCNFMQRSSFVRKSVTFHSSSRVQFSVALFRYIGRVLTEPVWVRTIQEGKRWSRRRERIRRNRNRRTRRERIWRTRKQEKRSKRMWKELKRRMWKWFYSLESHIIYISITRPKLNFFRMIWVCGVLLLSGPGIQFFFFYFFTSRFSVEDKEKLQSMQQSPSCAGSLIQWTESHPYNALANHTRG